MATTRPRGFINWTPTPKVAARLAQVQDILDENSHVLPLTIRQIFYMLVSGYDYPKDEKAYKRLIEMLGKARRAQVVPMHAIRDDEMSRKTPSYYDDEQAAINACKRLSSSFTLDRQAGQVQRIYLWCEAGGMLPQIARYCRPYGVSVLSSGGFDSLTTKHSFASEVQNNEELDNQETLVFHVGDHDPSGVHMHSSLQEDVAKFVEQLTDGYAIFNVQRLAVTPEQITAMGLPTAPPKRTDNRSFVGQTTQAEAIKPNTLKEIIETAIRNKMDMQVYEQVLEEEREIRQSLLRRLSVL